MLRELLCDDRVGIYEEDFPYLDAEHDYYHSCRDPLGHDGRHRCTCGIEWETMKFIPPGLIPRSEPSRDHKTGRFIRR
jgi:hypothetical protein